MHANLTDRLADQLAFLHEIEKLKLVYRRNKTVDQARYENSAEHSWHVAVMALVLAEHVDTPNIDICRVLKMLLIHDLVEIYAGDTWLYDTHATRAQAHNEAHAADALFQLLPGDQAHAFHELWHEFNSRTTPEAAFAAAVDALQPLMNHLLSGTPELETLRLAQHDVRDRKQHIAASSQALWHVAQGIITASTHRGLYR